MLFHCRLLPYLFLFLAAAAPCRAHETITICGTGDSQHLLRVLGHFFEESHHDTTIHVPDSVGSSGGIRLTAEGQCELGRTARPLKEKEKKYNLQYTLFASSPVVFIVHENVPVSDMTSEQATAVLSGKIHNWRQLGGDDMNILIANREAGDSSRTALEKNIPALKDISNWAGETIFSTQETIDTVSRYKGTVSFAPLAMANAPKVRILTYNGVAPTPENVQAGLYPLTVPLGLVWREELSGSSKAFVEFIKTPQAKKILLQNGAIPAE